MRRRLLLALPAAAVLAVVIAGVGFVIRPDAPAPDSPLLVAPPTTEAPTTTTARAVPVTTTTIPLPVPEPPPADPYADVPVVEIGAVVIPKIGVDHPVYEGITLTVIDRGPGHWPGSAMPGRRGNAVFPGHRVTHSRPFYDLDLLAPGDEVGFRMGNGTFTYAVTSTQIVVPTDLWVVDQTEEHTMTLIACHPKRSARQRIVVKGELVRSEPSLASIAAARIAAGAMESLA